MGYRRSWKQIVLSSSLLLVATAKPAFAVDLVLNHRISAPLANEAVAAVVSTCAVKGYTESATLVDIDGVPEATLRGDGAGVHTQESASDKAYTSVSLKIDTLTLKGQVQNTVAPGDRSRNCLIFCCSAVASSSSWDLRPLAQSAPLERRETRSTTPVLTRV